MTLESGDEFDIKASPNQSIETSQLTLEIKPM